MNKLQWIMTIAIILFMTIGGILGSYLFERAFRLELILPIIAGAIIGLATTFFIDKWKRKRNGNVPDVDERTLKNMQRYLLIVLYVLLIGGGAVLIALYASGIHAIETVWLIVSFMVIYIVIGLGAFVAKNL
ncbi:hypothetical protein [Alkalihalobacillus pseudalcaliphilus]|uniref:hypothetical protein n=1 Tax=Alkalihalobacillus pseudalcaliphilus TaxID=79884 RepID=UPI00064E13DF|nr:hypothetical protein [Alkalihalobacillus pseudalcaliphilus]KMK75544.1 hypothetical protein AB990_09610 [Alkalihalobacillus pseudalcaliphilus]